MAQDWKGTAYNQVPHSRNEAARDVMLTVPCHEGRCRLSYTLEEKERADGSDGNRSEDGSDG